MRATMVVRRKRSCPISNNKRALLRGNKPQPTKILCLASMIIRINRSVVVILKWQIKPMKYVLKQFHSNQMMMLLIRVLRR